MTTPRGNHDHDGAIVVTFDNIPTAKLAAAFTVTDLGDDRVALRADNGRYLRADFGGGAGLSAASSALGDNQTFTLLHP